MATATKKTKKKKTSKRSIDTYTPSKLDMEAINDLIAYDHSQVGCYLKSKSKLDPKVGDVVVLRDRDNNKAIKKCGLERLFLSIYKDELGVNYFKEIGAGKLLNEVMPEYDLTYDNYYLELDANQIDAIILGKKFNYLADRKNKNEIIKKVKALNTPNIKKLHSAKDVAGLLPNISIGQKIWINAIKQEVPYGEATVTAIYPSTPSFTVRYANGTNDNIDFESFFSLSYYYSLVQPYKYEDFL